MSYTVTAKIEGLEEMQRAFAIAPELINREMRDALEATGAVAEGTAKNEAPHDKGNLRGSINQGRVTGLGLDMELTVGTNLDYAKHQEYGTGIYGKTGKPITPKRGKFLRFKYNGRWVYARSVKGTRGKFYMKKGKEAARPVLHSRMTQAVTNIVRRLAS